MVRLTETVVCENTFSIAPNPHSHYYEFVLVTGILIVLRGGKYDKVFCTKMCYTQWFYMIHRSIIF
jgi:hypothetical protein